MKKLYIFLQLLGPYDSPYESKVEDGWEEEDDSKGAVDDVMLENTK